MQNIKINIEKLADGLLQMIQEHPDGACLTLGMLPAEIMECFEKNLEIKLPGDTYKELRRDTVRNVTVAILRQATKQNLCIV